MNTKRKEQFIAEQGFSGSMNKAVVSFFRQAAVYEDYFQLDLCEFALPQYIEMFAGYKWVNASTFNVYRSWIKRYVKWCIAHGHTDSPAAIERVDLRLVAASVSRSVLYADENDFLETIRQVYGGDTVDSSSDRYNMVRTFWYLAWLGFTRDEAVLITKTDVKDTSIETKSWSVYNINPKIMDVIKDTANTTETTIYADTPRGLAARTRMYVDSPYLLRPLKRNGNSATVYLPVATMDTWTSVAKKLQKENVPIISPYRTKSIIYRKIYMCGRFNAMREWEVEHNCKVTTDNALEWGVLTRHVNEQNEIRESMYNFLRTYYRWKHDFWEQ